MSRPKTLSPSMQALIGPVEQRLPGIAQPALERLPHDVYDPDQEIFGRDVNAVEGARRTFKRFFREAKAGRASLSVDCIAYDGARERIQLNETDTTAYVSAQSLDDRKRLLDVRIRERRIGIANNAAGKLREGKPIKALHPIEEAALREFGGIVSRDVNGTEIEQLREDWGYGYNPTDAQISQRYTDQEWLPYGQGPLGYQMYLADYWDAVAKSWWAWQHDPLAKRGVNLIVSYVLGRGVQVKCDDEDAQMVVDEFWTRERMDQRIRRWTTDLGRDGNLFAHDMPDRIDVSKTRVRSLDATTIWEIITDAEDIEFVYAFVQRYMTRTQLFPPPDGSPAQKWIERDLSPDEVIHVKINASSSEVYGRPDTFACLGYLKRARDYFDSEIIKAQAQAAWHRDITVDGSDADVQTFASTQQTSGKPQPGEDWFHNKAVEIELVTAQNRAPAGNGSVWAGIINIIAIGFGLSKEDFGVAEHASLASAQETGEPSERFLDERQQLVREFVQALIARVLKRAQRAGRLKPGAKLDVDIIMPEIQREDFVKRLTWLATGEAMDWWSKETAAANAAGEVNLRNFDYDTEKQKIISERGAEPNIAKQFEQVPKLVDKASPAFPPGSVVNPNESIRESGILIIP